MLLPSVEGLLLEKLWNENMQFEDPGKASIWALIISAHGTEELDFFFWAPVALWIKKKAVNV